METQEYRIDFTHALKKLHNKVVKNLCCENEMPEMDLMHDAIVNFWFDYSKPYWKGKGADYAELCEQIKAAFPGSEVQENELFRTGNCLYILRRTQSSTLVAPCPFQYWISTYTASYLCPLSDINVLVAFDDALPAFRTAIENEIVKARHDYIISQLATSAVEATANIFLDPLGIEYYIKEKAQIIKLFVPLRNEGKVIMANIHPGEESETISAIPAIFKDKVPIPEHLSEKIQL